MTDLAYAGRMGASSEHVALVALLRNLRRGERWGDITELLLEQGSAMEVLAHREPPSLTPDPLAGQHWDLAAAEVVGWSAQPHRFLSILDADYPARLREIHQAPPFLFAKGSLVADDRAIAVVGSRAASPEGLQTAAEVARRLAQEGITVLSGLAAGIDSAAHTSALDAGGRTVALIGTGIARHYPAANRDLQERISRDGLVLSQFWPDGPPQAHNFLMRNAVMSGYGRASVVVEAGETSGARAQARMAVEHGRPVILTDRVVESNVWAKKLVGRPGVHTAEGPSEILEHIHRVLDRERRVDGVLADLLSIGI